MCQDLALQCSPYDAKQSRPPTVLPHNVARWTCFIWPASFPRTLFFLAPPLGEYPEEFSCNSAVCSSTPSEPVSNHWLIHIPQPGNFFHGTAYDFDFSPRSSERSGVLPDGSRNSLAVSL
jgi:hypothetical protein